MPRSTTDRPASTGSPPADGASRGAWLQPWVSRFLLCRNCGADELRRQPEGVVCSKCGHCLQLVGPGLLEDLPDGFRGDSPRARVGGDSVTARVRSFYEEHPFPNYDGFESVGDLAARARRSVYAEMLDRQIPLGASVLEIGCGTGQLGAYISMGGRSVVGVDMTRASLELAGNFKLAHGLDNCNFIHGNLFDLPLKPASFDLVIAKGVLMATPDPQGGFRAVCRSLRPGGYVIVGLYNRFGRIPTSFRKLVFRLTKGKRKNADYVIREMAKGDEKRKTWFLDQYAHPHETRHSVGQVLRWFREEGIDFTSAVPPIRLGESFDADRSLFASVQPGSAFEYGLVQLSWILSISREGALFDMIGRKPAGEAKRAERGGVE